MLERVPASAESAANLLVRSFDRPIRSTRILDPRFWRHGVEELDTASWWPLYLQKIRQVPHDGNKSPKEQPVAPLSHSQTASRGCYDTVANRNPQGYAHNGSARHYTVSTAKRQAQHAKRLYDVFNSTEDTDPISEEVGTNTARDTVARQELPLQRWKSVADIRVKRGDADAISERDDGVRSVDQELLTRHNPSTHVSGWDVHSGFASLVPDEGQGGVKDTTMAELGPTQLEIEGIQDERVENKVPHNEKHQELFNAMQNKQNDKTLQFDEVWRVFTRLADQEAVAPAVFDFLQKSRDRNQLSRAINAFELISEERRTEDIYKAAMDVELKRPRLKRAMNIAFEASVRGFDLLPVLFNYFVEHLLWNSAAELVQRCQADEQVRVTSVLAMTKEDSKHLFSRCGAMPDLLSKVTSLAERLKWQDATLTQSRLVLQGVCRVLTVECARSSAVIDCITREGVLALLDLGNHFGQDQLHETILTTIFKHPHRAQYADLALFVYRNYRLAMSNDSVPARILGRLLSICGDAKVDFHIYSYLLREFSLHCTAQESEAAYQRVLTFCARQGQAYATEQFLQAYIGIYGKPKSLAMLTPLIYVRAVSGDYTNARKQFDRLKDEFQLKPNQICWNMLILARVRSDNDSSAFEVFEEMVASGVEPDSYTYGTLLAVCASQADMDAAVELLAEARDSNIPITIPMIGSVVEACLSNDDERQALGFVYAATASGTQESLTWLWNILLRYYSFKGDTNAMLRVRKRMADSEVKADDMTYAALISDLISRKRTVEAIQLLRDMHFQEGLPVTLFHYSMVLHGLAMEGNRDMALVIYTEVKQRFPYMSASVDVAMLNLQSQRDTTHDSTGGSEHALHFLSTLLMEAGRQHEALATFGPSNGPKSPQAIWFGTFEAFLSSLIRNGSYDQAQLLLRNLQSSKWSDDLKDKKHISDTLLLASMDLAIARQEWEEVEEIWQNLFNREQGEYRAVKLPSLKVQTSSGKSSVPDTTIHDTGGTNSRGITDDLKSEVRRPVLGRQRFSLSAPLNRYMAAMAQAGRLDDLWHFIQNKFQPAGFELSGRNWNKYIQLLCNSQDDKHKIAAFTLMEKTLLKHAQSWKLLTRGLLRRKHTRHVLEASSKDQRPVMQKRDIYHVTKRDRLMRLQPERKIPTYLTFVHLADVLQQAARRAKFDRPGLMMKIQRVAGKTKNFVQRMPYLKDRIQGTLLRKQPARPDAKPRPRSELSLRKSTDLSGILGSKSPLDHVPAELLDDIEALISPLDDTRQLLRRDRAMALSPQQQREVAVGEQIIGQIDRGSIVLAAKGRREGSHDREGRITLEEKQRLQTVAHIRHDLRTQRLLESTDRGRPAIPVPSALPETYPTSSSSHLKASSEILAQLHGVKTNTNKQLVSDAANDQVQDTPSQLPTKSGSELVTKPFDKLSVSEQLERLESYRESIAERSQSLFSTASEPKSSKLAIPYASLRRTRRIHANRQRAVTQAIIRKAGEHQFSARSRSQTWNSLRVLQSQELARQRRALILQQEQDLKAGKRLPPMPKTRRTVRRSRNLNNPNIRFVSDLNRKKWRYQVRRGLKLDPRLLAAESKEQKQVPSAQVAETELETVQRRHPVLTKIREMEMKDNARGSPADSTQQRKTRRRKPKAIQLGIPTPKPETNFKPITLDDT